MVKKDTEAFEERFAELQDARFKALQDARYAGVDRGNVEPEDLEEGRALDRAETQAHQRDDKMQALDEALQACDAALQACDDDLAALEEVEVE